MKTLNFFLTLGVLIAFLAIAGCGEDEPDGPTIQEQQREALVGTWTTSSASDVKLNGADAPGDWDNFSITFTAQGDVSVTGDDPTNEVDIFQLSQYEILGDQINSFTLQFNDDASETATVTINGTSMTMSFTLSADDKLGAKVLSVEGNWVFNLTKNQ
jgi:hypothetical protein